MVKSGAYDSRLLLNLIKADKEVHDSFKQYTFTCENANNALNGWAAADTGDSPDVLTASNRVCELFDEAFEAQKTYLIGLNNYRASLKDVSAREAEIRVIMRDRDIFVSRLVKLNSKKTPTSDSAFEAHSGKLEEARAELAACESTLKSEERALVGVKRRIFREALRMRMRAMAQLADTWRDTAERSIDILDSLDPDNSSMTDPRLASQQAQAPPPTHIHGTPHSQRHSRNFDVTSPEGSVIAPSHSASQVARRAGGYGEDEYSEDERDARGTILNNGRGRRESSATQPIEEAEEERGGSSDDGDNGMDPKKYQVHINKPLTPAELAAQKRQQQQQQNNQEGLGMASNNIQPAPSQVAQPRAPQPNTLNASAGAGGGLSNGIRKRLSSAPTPSSAAAPQQQQAAPARSGRETAEERQKRFSTLSGDAGGPAVAPAIALPSASAYTVEAHRKKNAPEATMYLPSSNSRTTSYRATRGDSDDDSAAGTEQRDEVRGLNKSTSSRKLQSKRSSHMYQDSDAGGSTVRGGSRHEKSRSEGHKSGGLFGTFGSLFKKRDMNAIKGGRDDDDDDKAGRGWSSRTDTNLARSGGGGGEKTKKKKKSRQEDSDSDAPDPRSLVRVQNDPLSSRNSFQPVTMTFSDIGAPRSRTVSSKAAQPASTWVPPDQRERQRSMSDVGVARKAAPASAVKRKSTIGDGTSGLDRKSSIKSTATTGTTGTVKKKKKVVPAAGTGTGTAGSAPTGTLSVPPTLTSSSRASSYDAGALVSNLVHQQGQNRTTNQNPAQRVTRDTPSLMSVVAPSSQTATIGGMHMPSAKNPSLSRSNSMASYSLGTLPPPSSSSNVGVPDAAPLKKKKTVKRSSTVGNVADSAAPASTMRSSATTPSFPPSSTVTRPKAPASILSDGSAVGRRKSVRLADDTRVSEAKYDNAGGPANIQPVTNGQSQAGNGASNAQGYNGEWATRIGKDPDISSDEEGDEYAKIRMQLNKSERELKGAGFLDKGKGRASQQ